MPLPSEVLEEIRARNESVKKRIKELEEILFDLRASGVDASKQEERLVKLQEEQRKWESFYDLQSKRKAGE